jgi:hypothetical protein
MATHPQGKGTTNVAVNLLTEEKSVLGKLAAADDRSLGDYMRRLTMAGLRQANPAAAVELENIRRAHHEQKTLHL